MLVRLTSILSSEVGAHANIVMLAQYVGAAHFYLVLVIVIHATQFHLSLLVVDHLYIDTIVAALVH